MKNRAGPQQISEFFTLAFRALSSVCSSSTETTLGETTTASPEQHPTSRQGRGGRPNWNCLTCLADCDLPVAQSCLTLCVPMDSSLPGSAAHGIFQARILEWAAISFSRGSSQPRDRTRVSCIADRCFTIWATREAQKFSVGSNSLQISKQRVFSVLKTES